MLIYLLLFRLSKELNNIKVKSHKTCFVYRIVFFAHQCKSIRCTIQLCSADVIFYNKQIRRNSNQINPIYFTLFPLRHGLNRRYTHLRIIHENSLLTFGCSWFCMLSACVYQFTHCIKLNMAEILFENLRW